MKCKLKGCKNKAKAYFRSLEVCDSCYLRLRWDSKLMKGVIKLIDERNNKR